MLGFGPISSVPLSALAGATQPVVVVPAVIPHDDYDQPEPANYRPPPEGYRRVTDLAGQSAARAEALRQARRDLGIEKEPEPPPAIPSEISVEPIDAAPPEPASPKPSRDYAKEIAAALVDAIHQDDAAEAFALRLRRDNEDVLMLLAALA